MVKKTFFAAKDTIIQLKRHTSDTGLISRINNIFKRKNDNIKKIQLNWGKEFKRDFSKDETLMAEKHFLSCLEPLAIREIQIKTTLRES